MCFHQILESTLIIYLEPRECVNRSYSLFLFLVLLLKTSFEEAKTMTTLGDRSKQSSEYLPHTSKRWPGSDITPLFFTDKTAWIIIISEPTFYQKRTLKLFILGINKILNRLPPAALRIIMVKNKNIYYIRFMAID